MGVTLLWTYQHAAAVREERFGVGICVVERVPGSSLAELGDLRCDLVVESVVPKSERVPGVHLHVCEGDDRAWLPLERVVIRKRRVVRVEVDSKE